MMHRNLSIRRIRSFVTVAEMGSITVAAKFLSQTQGAISQQISKLEEELSTELFNRTASGLLLTNAGGEIYKKAKELIVQNDNLAASSEKSSLLGAVSIGFPLDLSGKELVGKVIRSFIESHPNVEVKISYGSSQSLKEQIDQKVLDIALLEEHPDRSTGELLYRERLVWIGAEKGKSCDAKILPVSLVSEHCVYRPYVLTALAGINRAWKCVFESGSYEATVAMIRMDLAIGVVLASTIPGGCCEIDSANGLPKLPEIDVSLVRSGSASEVVDRLGTILHATFSKP